MEAKLIDRMETAIEHAASASLGVAVGYSAYAWLDGVIPGPALYACAAAAAGAAFLLCSSALGRLNRRRPQFPVSVFDLREFDDFGADELLLTDRLNGELVLSDADRLEPMAKAPAEEPLLLDNVLAELGPDSRVVRLFDPAAMPTPGQLKSRIDDHLGQGPAAAASTDASQALSDALAELRRSLR
jgi:hypothetical protein